MHIEQYTRQPDQRWLLTDYTDPESTIALQSVSVDLKVRDIYEKVDFTTEPRV